MGASSNILELQKLHEFQKLNPGTTAKFELPVPPQNRTITDKKGFLIFGVLMLILLPFLIYTLVKSDIRRLDHGSDSCGNLCGVANKKVTDIECSGKNYTDKPYEIFVSVLTGEQGCTDECPPGYYLGNDSKCYDYNSSSESENLLTYSFKLWWKFLITFLITTVFCILTLVLIRYFPAVVVWTVSVLGLLTSIAIASLFWFLFSYEDNHTYSQAFLAIAMISTIFTFLIIIVFLIFRKNIQLIVLLYKETAKALFAMPLMMLVPVITLVLQFCVLFLMLYTTAYMQTAGNLTKNKDDQFYSFKRNGAMVFAMVFNTIVTVWTLEFFTGFQYMVLAGSVAQWFFNKASTSPIVTSLGNSVKYHLGTLSFGASILTLVAVIKGLVKTVFNNFKLRWLVDCCCVNIEALLGFLSKNAYIETAIYGQSFLRSGRRAANLLLANATSVLSVNSMGDFVLGMTQFILLVISTAIGFWIFSNNADAWFPITLSFFGNLVIVMVVFNAFETIVDTMLVCFCEDHALNDGTTRPYNMSTGYMQFVEKTKTVSKK